MENQVADQYPDGQLYVADKDDNFLVQLIEHHGDTVVFMNAFQPLDLNEMLPGRTVASKADIGYKYMELDEALPKFMLWQLCRYKGKLVNIRSRYFDMRNEERGWKYVIAPCRDSAGTDICNENKLEAIEGELYGA